MNLTEYFLNQLEAEAPRTRRALERVPEGDGGWKPHDKSMPLGRLAVLVATMPSWVGLILDQDQLDLAPPGGTGYTQPGFGSAADLVRIHDEAVAGARRSLAATSDAHLATSWRLLVSGQVVSEESRRDVLRDTFMHQSHHRGQLTVYLRLKGAPVPAIYGPSADDAQFR